MTIELKKRFQKRFDLLQPSLQEKVRERLQLFLIDPYDPVLNNHFLDGDYAGCRSINITGDYRAIYFESPKNHAAFLIMGTHPQLYG